MNYTSLRKKYPVFRYESFAIEQGEGCVLLRWRFSIDGLAVFQPTTRIITENHKLLNALDSLLTGKIVFAMGLCEALSYWKCACPAVVEIMPGNSLDDWDINWWKTLWYQGLGEFFYRNEIDTDFDDFVTFSKKNAGEIHGKDESSPPELTDRILIPVGGGKDSCVTLDLLADKTATLFTINDQPARTQCAAAAGYGTREILRCYRTIDGELLRLNTEGYLNGHTPFSAVTAFLSLLCAHLIGAGEIALSNESSANEPSVAGTQINHQYSKSYAFERDFRQYAAKNFGNTPVYYSLLRPFNELQIAARFSALDRFHSVFRSCNAGSKTNTWCGKCGKCLFTFGMLSAFLPPEKTAEIFGGNLFEDTALLPELEGLCGITAVKPFECVGTTEEFCAALSLTLPRYVKLPPLLEIFSKWGTSTDPAGILGEKNNQHFVPPDKLGLIENMQNAVKLELLKKGHGR
ncbi:MAG: hypothetical protein FWG82_01095 [Oscillospiraceae bacterium]|nr:hypothetical protein [Oscillospiraceae bacterium]